MTDWKRLSKRIVHKTAWIELVEEKLIDHNNKPLTYTFMRLPKPAVTVVAVNKAGEILLQENYRPTLSKKIIETPSGHAENDTPIVAAKREPLEEAGLASERWISLGFVHLAAGIVDINQHLFVALDVTSVSSERDRDEPISNQRFVSERQIKAMLETNEIVDVSTLVTLYKYFDGKKRGACSQTSRTSQCKA